MNTQNALLPIKTLKFEIICFHGNHGKNEICVFLEYYVTRAVNGYLWPRKSAKDNFSH